MRQLVISLAAVSVMAGAGSACATKKFVRGQVDEVNGRVETLGQSLEATQQREPFRQERVQFPGEGQDIVAPRADKVRERRNEQKPLGPEQVEIEVNDVYGLCLN